MILSDRENKLAKPNHRLMLSMSVFDILSSFAIATSTWPFPRESNIYGSMGNMTTCKVQYFFGTLGLAVPMYNASLCLLYLLTIRYRLHQRHFTAKIEPYLHAASVLFPLTIATVPIVMDAHITPANLVCAIAKDSPMKWPMKIVPLLSFCVCSYSMASISCYVHARSKKITRYSYGRNQMRRRESERRAIIRQAILYTAAFFITWMFQAIRVVNGPTIPLLIMNSIFYPLQGFWNFLLYVRPNVMKMKKAQPDKYLYEIIWNVVIHSHERNEEVRQRWRKNDNKCQIQIKNLDSHLDANINRRKICNSEESKQEISDNLPGPGAVGQTSILTTYENVNVGALNNDECEICEETIESCPVPHTPLASVTPDDQLHILDETVEICAVRRMSLNFTTAATNLYDSDNTLQPCPVRRASLVFAFAVDDISFDSLDSQESVEETTSPGTF